jgi:uncharacterized protein involved in exopolysaccharide biosynthesis
MPSNTHLDDAGLHRIGAVKTSYEPAPGDVGEIPLERLRQIVTRWGRWIAVAAVAGAALGVLVASLGPPIYDSVATLLVIQPTAPSDVPRPPNLSTFRALLETNAIAAQAIDRFHLDREPYRKSPDDFLKTTVILEDVRGSNLIRVHARLADAQVAAALADFMVSRAIALNEEIDRQEISDFRGQLRTMLDDATRQLQTTEGKLLEFRKNAQVDVTKRDADAALDQRGQLLALTADIEAEKARLDRAELEIKGKPKTLALPRAVDAESVLRALDPRSEVAGVTRKPAAPADTTADADKQPIDLTNAYVNPVYQVLDYQIALSRTRLASLEGRRRQLVAVQGLDGRELKSLSSLYPKEIQLRRLETENELARTVYSEVALQYERARLQIASGSSRLQMIDKAVPPTRPVSRRRTLWALLGALTAGVAAVAAVAAVEFLRRR